MSIMSRNCKISKKSSIKTKQRSTPISSFITMLRRTPTLKELFKTRSNKNIYTLLIFSIGIHPPILRCKLYLKLITSPTNVSKTFQIRDTKSKRMISAPNHSAAKGHRGLKECWMLSQRSSRTRKNNSRRTNTTIITKSRAKQTQSTTITITTEAMMWK